MQIIRLATEKNPLVYRKDPLQHNSWLYLIDKHRRHCAFEILTCQRLNTRNIVDKGTERQITTWRVVQIILFILLFYGICPTDWEEGIAISRGWILILLLGFTVTSALCRFYEKSYKQYQRETSVLNAIVTEADVAAYLRSEDYAKEMKAIRESPGCKYRRELDGYLYWYEVQEKAPLAVRQHPGADS